MAARFWVGGTGTWDNSSTTHWATSSGGSSGAAAPTSADAVTFDGNSGASAVITAGANVTAASVVLGVTGGNFTGTLDFNGNSPTFGSFSFSGSGTRTLNGGAGTITLTAANGNCFDLTTVTGATINCGSTALTFTNTSPVGPARTFITGGQTFGAITISAGTTTASANVFQVTAAANTTTFASLTLNGPLDLTISPSNQTITLSAAPTWTGTATNPILIAGVTLGATTPQTTFAISSGNPALSYVALAAIKFTIGTSGTAINSFDLSNNAGITITPPSGGGTGVIGS